MPGFNQRGPEGMGPMTGWGRGVCAASRPGYGRRAADNDGSGRTVGAGRGFRRRCRFDMGGFRGRGQGRGRNAVMQTNPANTYSDLDTLKAQAESIQRTLETLNNRINELENNS